MARLTIHKRGKIQLHDNLINVSNLDDVKRYYAKYGYAPEINDQIQECFSLDEYETTYGNYDLKIG